MAARVERSLRGGKEAKQKKLLLLLIPALVIVLVIQGPRLLDQVRGAQEKTESVQGQVVEGFKEVAPTDATTTTVVSGDQTLTPAEALSAATIAAGGLVDTDTPTPAGEGQLVSFTRFSARDPFVQIVEDTGAADGAAPPGGTSDTGAIPGTEPFPVTGTTTTTSTGTTTAVGGTTTTTTTQASISVNGNVAVVSVGGTFPASDPAFKLVAIEGNVVKIGLASGSFSTGGETLNLEVGDSVTLISQPDGARFTLKVIKLG